MSLVRRGPWTRPTLAVCALVAIPSGCGRIDFDAQPGDAGTGGVDARPSDAPGADATPRDACLPDAWEVTALAGLSSPGTDWGAHISLDGLTLFFSSDRFVNSDLDLYVVTRASRDASFDAPRPLAALNTGSNESNPSPSADLSELFFDRAGIIVHAHRELSGEYVEDGAVTGLDLGGTNVAAPYLASDGRTLYFSRHECDPTCSFEVAAQVELAMRAGPAAPLAFGSPSLVPLTGASLVGYPALSDDMRVLLLEGRAEVGAPADIYMATRATTSSPWSALEPVAELNTPGEDSDPSITGDGLELYFAAEVAEDDHDLFRATRMLVCP